MNYRYETIMTWIMYVKNKIWQVDKNNNYAEDGEVVVNKYNDLFKRELERECNDSLHFMANQYKHLGTISVFIKPDEFVFNVSDCYNNLLCYYNGIYKTFNEKMVCLDTEARGYNAKYFVLCEENDRYVSLKSIVEGNAKRCPNVRRVISMLYARQWPYIENINPDDFMFMDYSEEEKEELVRDCKRCEPLPPKKKWVPDEEQ